MGRFRKKAHAELENGERHKNECQIIDKWRRRLLKMCECVFELWTFLNAQQDNQQQKLTLNSIQDQGTEWEREREEKFVRRRERVLVWVFGNKQKKQKISK